MTIVPWWSGHSPASCQGPLVAYRAAWRQDGRWPLWPPLPTWRLRASVGLNVASTSASGAGPAAGPAGLTAATHHRIRHDRIDDSGVITIRYNSRLHHIGIGRAHARTHVLALIADLDIRVITRDTGELLRALTLNPAKDYQPQPRKQNDVPRHL